MKKSVEDKPVIGVVGGIGAGKSAAAAEFAALGCAVVDADAIGHALLADRDVKTELKSRWGDRIFNADGSVDRAALAEIVFNDSSELDALNSVMHPRMRAIMERRIAAAMSDPAAKGVVIDAAVLFEAGWDDLCTHVVFVGAPEELRLRCLSGRPGWDASKMALREKFQISLDKKAEMCDYYIDNSSTVARLREQVGELIFRIHHSAD